MKVLITAGGTQEPVDSIRSITNHATGALGAMIADGFGALAAVEEIVYLCTRHSTQPKTPKAKVQYVRGTQELEKAIGEIAREFCPDVIIHSMAVSDYQVRRITTVRAMAAAAKVAAGQDQPELEAALSQAPELESGGKISSSVADMVLLLEKTPKIISGLRALAPQAVIVGFKLLDGVSQKELLDTAGKLLTQNDCNFVLANDMETLRAGCHQGHLLDRQGAVQSFTGKAQIAEGIVRAVCEKAVAG